MLHKEFREFLALLAGHKARHLVVGGYAVAVHGYPRYTGDLDVFIALDPQTADAVTAALLEFGFAASDVEASLFLEPNSIVEIGREPLKLHIMNAVTGLDFAHAYAHRHVVQIDDLDVPFISYEDLLANKSATGRGKDLVDVEELKRRRASA